MGVACHSYTTPVFTTTNENSTIISSVASTYYANYSQWAFSGTASVSDTEIFSASSNTGDGSKRFATMIFLNCKSGDEIKLELNVLYSSNFQGEVTIIGFK